MECCIDIYMQQQGQPPWHAALLISSRYSTASWTQKDHASKTPDVPCHMARAALRTPHVTARLLRSLVARHSSYISCPPDGTAGHQARESIHSSPPITSVLAFCGSNQLCKPSPQACRQIFFPSVHEHALSSSSDSIKCCQTMRGARRCA